jgi:RNA polymerase sigma factor (sigma-70 family)
MQEIIKYTREKLFNYAMALCNRHKQNAEDLLHDTIYKLLVHADSYKDKPIGEQIKIAVTTMKNRYFDIIGQTYNKNIILGFNHTGIEDDNLSWLANNNTIEQDIDRKIINRYIKDVKKECFKATKLIIIGYSMAEIAKFNGVHIGTVLKYHHNSKQELKRVFNIEEHKQIFKPKEKVPEKTLEEFEKEEQQIRLNEYLAKKRSNQPDVINAWNKRRKDLTVKN